MIARDGIPDEKLRMTEVGDPRMSPVEIPTQVGDDELMVEITLTWNHSDC